MAETVLTAVLKAQENVSEALADIATALEDVAGNASITDDTLDSVSKAADSARGASDRLTASLNKTNEDLSDVSIAAMEAAQETDDLESSMDGVSRAQSKLSGTAEVTESKLNEEAQTFREALRSADSLAEAKGAASRANSVLSSTAKRTEEAVEEEIGAMYRMIQASNSVSEFIDKLRNSNLQAAKAADILQEEMNELSVAALSTALPAKFFETVLDGVQDSLEEVNDEAQEAALSIAGLGGAFSSTSLSLGPFNFALRRAAVQLPQLVITTGALATSLLGVASAAVIAGGALAGIFAGGLIAKAEQVQASSSDIENRLEAIEEIAGQVRDMFIRALEPLIDAESVAIFEGTIESLAVAVNMLAQLADNLQDELVAAGQEISNAFGDNAQSILSEMEDTVEAFLPVIVDLFVFFAKKLPNALQFLQDEGVAFTRTLGEFGKQIVGFFKTFIEVGIPILEGVITALSGVLAAFEMLAEVIALIPEDVRSAAVAFLFLSRIFDGVLSKGISIGVFFTDLGGSIRDAKDPLVKFNNVLGGLQLTGFQRAFGNILKQFNMLEPVIAESSEAARESMREFNELGLKDPGADPPQIDGDFTDPISKAIENVRSKFNSLREVTVNKISDIGGAIDSRASKIKDKLVAPFSRAKTAIGNRLTEINKITGDRSIASDVALGGPRLDDSQRSQDVRVNTRTEKARRKLSGLAEKASRTRNKIKDSLSRSVETALDVRFEDSGIRDMQTGQFTNFSKVVRSRVSGAFKSASESAKSFAKTGLSTVADGFRSVGARGVGLVSVVTGVGEAFVSAVPGLGNFERATENIRSGLATISPELASMKNSFVESIPSMDEANEAALRFADGLQNRLGTHIDSFNKKALKFADGLNDAISPAVDGANDRLLNFADALNPDQDITFTGILKSKLSEVIPSIEEVKSSILGIGPSMDELNKKALKFADGFQKRIDPSVESFNDKALKAADSLNEAISPAVDSANDRLINFADALDPNKDLTFYDIFKDKVSAAGEALQNTFGPPLLSARDKIFEVGSSVREAGETFASSIADIEDYDNAMELVGGASDKVKGRLKSFASGALDRLPNSFGAATNGMRDFVSGLIPANLGTKSLLGSMKRLALAPFKAVGSLLTLAGTLITQGSAAFFSSAAMTSLKERLNEVAARGIPVVSSAASMAASFIGLAASEGIATAMTKALKFALSSIGWTQIVMGITAVIAVAAAMAGILSNLGGISNAVGGAIDFLKGVLESIFNFLLAIGVPTWNLLVDVFEAILTPVFAVMDSFNRLKQALGFANKEGSKSSGVFDMIGTAFSALGDAIGFVIGLIQGPMNVIADILYTSFLIPLDIIVSAILLVIGVITKMIDAFMSLSIVQNTLSKISKGVEKIKDAFKAVKGIVSGAIGFVEGAIEGMANTVIGVLNAIINNVNKALPSRFEIGNIDEFEMGGGGSGGASGRLSSADASAEEAKENAEDMKKKDNEKAQDDQAPQPNHETNNYENNEYNFGDFNMNPEEKARVKGLVQDAIDEANREKRLRDGGN